jgi:hypothetical protein
MGPDGSDITLIDQYIRDEFGGGPLNYTVSPDEHPCSCGNPVKCPEGTSPSYWDGNKCESCWAFAGEPHQWGCPWYGTTCYGRRGEQVKNATPDYTKAINDVIEKAVSTPATLIQVDPVPVYTTLYINGVCIKYPAKMSAEILSDGAVRIS